MSSPAESSPAESSPAESSPAESRPAIRSDIALMDGYHSPQIDVAIRLNTNEAPEPPPQAFRDAVADLAREVSWHRYPDRQARALRQAIAELEGVHSDQVFVANGSNEVLQSLLLLFGGAGRVALTFEPTYAMHSHIARVVGTTVVEGERDSEFRIPLDSALALVAEHRPSVTFLCSPNNPTGVSEPESLITEMLESVRAVNGLLVVDEAYGQFAPLSSIRRVAEDVPLVVTRTFSKTWSMAAARLGYLVGPTWLVEELEKVVLPYHLDAFKQAAGALALTFRAEMNQRVEQLVGERERVSEALSRLDLSVWDSTANFILFRPNTHSGTKVWEALVQRSILVRNCSSWPRLRGCLRVTLGTEFENTAFIDALGEILAEPPTEPTRAEGSP
jgi:histidinol-phosphate aminotransferase